MYCTQCGEKIEGNARFCTNCGTRIDVHEQPKEEETLEQKLEVSERPPIVDDEPRTIPVERLFEPEWEQPEKAGKSEGKDNEQDCNGAEPDEKVDEVYNANEERIDEVEKKADLNAPIEKPWLQMGYGSEWKNGGQVLGTIKTKRIKGWQIALIAIAGALFWILLIALFLLVI